jgi:carboxylesterase
MFRTRKRAILEQRMLGDGEREFFASGRAPCVVALHGFGGTVAEIRPALDALARTGLAVDAALLPGHGARVEELQDLTFDDWAAAARESMRKAVASHGRVVLLGFSLGSVIALQVASEKPEGLAGLVVLGNALTLRGHSSIPLGLWARAGWSMPDAYMTKPFSGDLVDKSAMGTIVTYDRHPLRAAMEVYRAGLRVRPVVGAITCPTLILHGRRDMVCSWKNAPWLAEHIGAKDVTVRIFEKSAHVLVCDGERDEVAKEIVTFVLRMA